MTDEIYCRVAFCQKCYNANRPSTNHPFLTFGTTRNDFFLEFASCIGNYGYTPHLIRFIKALDGVVSYDISCAMFNCGISSVWKGNETQYVVDKWSRKSISVVSWNAWMLYRRDPQYHV